MDPVLKIRSNRDNLEMLKTYFVTLIQSRRDVSNEGSQCNVFMKISK